MQKTLKDRAPLLLPIFLLILLATISSARANERCPLGFGMHSYEQHSQLKAGTNWKCDYPLFEHSPAGDSINAAILKTIAANTLSTEKQPVPATIGEVAAAFVEAGEESMRDEKQHAWPWEAQVSADVLLNQPGIVTVSIFSYTFTGGAHGMSTTRYLVFDTQSVRQLALHDLFKPGFKKTLDRMIERRFRQMRGLKPGEPLNGEKGGLFDNRISHTGNFAVTGSGIRFLYNQYDIAPYAAGPIEIELPFGELIDILKPLEVLKPLLHEKTRSSK